MDNESKSNQHFIEQWKLKKILHTLQSSKGNGTSVVSLIIPCKDQLFRVNKMLLDECAKATNIQCRVNRQAVIDTITSLQQRLKMFTKVPPNGLIAFCGTVLWSDGNEKKLILVFEPFKPINTSLYMCGPTFHTEALDNLLTKDDKFGFIIIDGHGCLFGTLSNSQQLILQKLHVDLPNKHGRGGQSQLRFARLRLEKHHNYIHKVAELATYHFITNNTPNIKALVLAGSADFKVKLNNSPLLDSRLAKIVVKIIDVAYGGENGFTQAIGLSADTLSNVHLIQEQQLLSVFYLEIAKNTGKSCFGISDTLFALAEGAVKDLLVNESLDLKKYVLKHADIKEERVVYLSEDQESLFFMKETIKWDIIEKTLVVDWIVNNYATFGATLQFITDRSQSGFQFCKGFGGVGGILRYKMDFPEENFSEQDFVFDAAI